MHIRTRLMLEKKVHIKSHKNGILAFRCSSSYKFEDKNTSYKNEKAYSSKDLSENLMSILYSVLFCTRQRRMASSKEIIKTKIELMNQVKFLGPQLPDFYPLDRGYAESRVDWSLQPMQRILHIASIIRPLDFWFKPYTKTLDEDAQPMPRWFVGGKLNVAYNCLDRHIIRGHGNRPALYWDSPITDTKKTITYQELLDQVEGFAHGLKSLGIGVGDLVMIYLPVIPEAVIAFLACARIGAVHSAVFGGFGVDELHRRITMLKPKVIIVSSCGIEPTRLVPYRDILDIAMERSMHRPTRVVIVQRPQLKSKLKEEDISWDSIMKEHRLDGHAKPYDISSADPSSSLVPLSSTHPLYVLYTSGTTADPKGVIRDTVGQLCAAHFALPFVFDVRQNRQADVYFAAGDLSWVLGTFLGVYGPLTVGATSVLFEGKPIGPPDAGVIFRICEDYKVKGLFTTPSALRGIKKADPNGDALKQHKTSTLKTVWCGGERFDKPIADWISKHLRKEKSRSPKVVDSWWQTETGFPISSTMAGIPDEASARFQPTYDRKRLVWTSRRQVSYCCRSGRTGGLIPGWNLHVLAEQVTESTISGPIVIKLPLPPGALITLHNGDDEFCKAYLKDFPGFFDTKDCGTWFKNENQIRIERRHDEVINVAAHRLSTASMEQALINCHPSIAEAVVVPIEHNIKGQVPLAFVVLHHFPEDLHKIRPSLYKNSAQILRDEIGPIASLENIIVLERLPRNYSTKVLRTLLVALVESTSIDYKRFSMNLNDDPHMIEKIVNAIKEQKCAPE